MNAAAINNSYANSQMNLNLNKGLSSSTTSWINAIAKSIQSESIDPTRSTDTKAYALSISQKGLDQMEQYKNINIAIVNSEVLTYANDLHLQYK